MTKYCGLQSSINKSDQLLYQNYLIFIYVFGYVISKSQNFFSPAICFCCIGFNCPVWANDIAFSSVSPWMLGDWNDQRSELLQQGYEFNLGYTGEMASLLNSPNQLKRSTQYADQFTFGTNLDLSKIFRWQDTLANITLTDRNGQNLSQSPNALSGQLSSVQEIWGRGETWRLTDFWIKKQFFDHKLDIKVGRFGEGEDFNSFDCNFQNLALCGSQVGNWVGDQWYNWPVSQWAVRIKYALQPNLYAQIGGFEVNPVNLKPNEGFNLSTNGSQGTMIPTELVWLPKIQNQQLSGEYRIGYYYSTVDADKIVDSSQTAHKHGMWFYAKQQLTNVSGQSNRGLTAFINLTFHDGNTNIVTNMQNIGLSYVGLSDLRPEDEMAMGLARIHADDKVSAPYDEYDTEIYYGFHATPWLTIRPNLQYVRYIGSEKDENNALVGGIKLVTIF